jgi:N-acetylmuramoyl-L-alanine amidase
MNSFPEERYNGLQVYFSPNQESSKILAQEIQKSVKTFLQPDNNRVCKEANESIYLLNRARNTSVLVECGFLSNKAECEALTNENYQKQLAIAIYNGIHKFIIENGT